MECVENALKTSIRKEIAPKSSPRAVFDDLWEVNEQNGAPFDDFLVDELLDFSNEDGFVEDKGEENACTVSVSPKEKAYEDDKDTDYVTDFSAEDDFASVPASELGVPADDLASLEWLSHFVEDSNSEYSMPFPTGTLPEMLRKGKWSQPEIPVLAGPCFNTPIPAKARSKRTRTGVRVWPLGSPTLTESSSSSSSSSSTSSPSSTWLIFPNPGMNLEPVCFQKPPAKKHLKKPAVESANGGVGSQQPRRCSHCGVQKTPQWRAGPLGAKTLCNACGVRYKSGRLLPEYRPACSPTFSNELHSNHHRKVLEMRKKKELLGEADTGLARPVVPSFG